jgi:hypothetical protein
VLLLQSVGSGDTCPCRINDPDLFRLSDDIGSPTASALWFLQSAYLPDYKI